MKIGFDIGGVISKYPQLFYSILHRLRFDTDFDISGGEDYRDCIKDLYVITDIHPKEKVLQSLIDNKFYSTYRSQGLTQQFRKEVWDNYYKGIIHPDNVYCADYEKYGNLAKAVLIKELKIDIFIDDFDGYLQWDSSLGSQPLLLKVMPDAFKPYWHDSWKTNDGEFGRKKYFIMK